MKVKASKIAARDRIRSSELNVHFDLALRGNGVSLKGFPKSNRTAAA